MTSQYVIEKNIPIPKLASFGITGALRSMEVGDSILFHDRTTLNIAQFFGQFKREGKKFAARQLQRGGLGARVWRVA